MERRQEGRGRRATDRASGAPAEIYHLKAAGQGAIGRQPPVDTIAHHLPKPFAARAQVLGPATRLFVCRLGREPVGLCEFDGRRFPEVELTHFGLVPSAQGRGLGRFLLDRSLRAVWALSPLRVWLHTDTWDHPRAVGTYRAAGFAVTERRWETYPD